MKEDKNLIIRSSSAEFLIFEMQKKEKGIEVRFEEGDLWLTQKALGELYNTTRNNITMHIQNIFADGELEDLERIVNAFLDLAEGRAKRNIPMTMEDWANRIDKYLLADDRDILKDAGKISHEIAEEKALTEFQKYRIKQDRFYQSDFDKLLLEAENKS